MRRLGFPGKDDNTSLFLHSRNRKWHRLRMAKASAIRTPAQPNKGVPATGVAARGQQAKRIEEPFP